MKLHTERFGAGPDLFIVHGWAMSGAVLRPWTETLADRWRVTLVDLPGHGASRSLPFERTRLPEQLVEVAPPGAVWLGWSLGGQLALQAQLEQGGAAGLLLLAASPCFCRRDDWPWGVPRLQVQAMRDQLAADPEPVVDGFLRLTASAGEGARAAVRELRPLLREQPAVPAALAAGLDALAEDDARPHLERLAVPALWLVGDADPLVPVAAVQWAAGHGVGEVRVLAGAGHYPFISHPAAVATELERLRPRG